MSVVVVVEDGTDVRVVSNGFGQDEELMQLRGVDCTQELQEERQVDITAAIVQHLWELH